MSCSSPVSECSGLCRRCRRLKLVFLAATSCSVDRTADQHWQSVFAAYDGRSHQDTENSRSLCCRPSLADGGGPLSDNRNNNKIIIMLFI